MQEQKDDQSCAHQNPVEVGGKKPWTRRNATGPDRTGPDRTGQDRREQNRTAQARTGQRRPGQKSAHRHGRLSNAAWVTERRSRSSAGQAWALLACNSAHLHVSSTVSAQSRPLEALALVGAVFCLNPAPSTQHPAPSTQSSQHADDTCQQTPPVHGSPDGRCKNRAGQNAVYLPILARSLACVFLGTLGQSLEVISIRGPELKYRP
ncbi:hypothetical protein PMIN06_000042 [Paraphaeosphaeria minitans]